MPNNFGGDQYDPDYAPHMYDEDGNFIGDADENFIGEIKMKFTPMEWLCAALSVAGRTKRSARDDGAFKIVKQDVNSVTVLHKETGAVWKFTTEVIRKPIS